MLGESFQLQLLALQVEEEGNKPRNAAASRSWNIKEAGSLLEPPEGAQPANSLI